MTLDCLCSRVTLSCNTSHDELTRLQILKDFKLCLKRYVRVREVRKLRAVDSEVPIDDVNREVSKKNYTCTVCILKNITTQTISTIFRVLHSRNFTE